MRVTGINEMMNRVRQLGERAKKVENNALKAGAEVLKDTMARNAPGPSNKRRVHLKDNIVTSRVITRADGKAIRVGPGKDSFYAHFLEFGTTKMSPRPFVENSVVESDDEVLDAIASELRDGLGL